MWVEAEFDTGPLRGYGFPPVNSQQPGKSSPKVSEERPEIKPGQGGGKEMFLQAVVLCPGDTYGNDWRHSWAVTTGEALSALNELRPGVLVNILQCPGHLLSNKERLAPNVNSNEVEKS